MAKALYYNENLSAKEFDILAEDKKAGTVDLGTGKVVAVRGVKVVPAGTPVIGCASLVDAETEADSDTGKSPLDFMNKAELLAEVEKFNATATDEKRIGLAPNATKAEIVAAMTKATAV